MIIFTVCTHGPYGVTKLFTVGRCTLRNAECGILKRCILRNFTRGKFLRNKVYFAQLKLQKMFLLLSYVN